MIKFLPYIYKILKPLINRPTHVLFVGLSPICLKLFKDEVRTQYRNLWRDVCFSPCGIALCNPYQVMSTTHLFFSCSDTETKELPS